jgi:hypothetical protein
MRSASNSSNNSTELLPYLAHNYARHAGNMALLLVATRQAGHGLHETAGYSNAAPIPAHL